MSYKKEPSKKERYAKLKSLKDRLEYGYNNENGTFIDPDEYVELYLKWQSLTPIEQAQAHSEWKKYYKDARKSRAYSLYREIGEAFKIKDTGKLKGLVEKNIVMHKKYKSGDDLGFPEPKSIDPFSSSRQSSVFRYKQTLRELYKLEKESREMEIVNLF